jgi:hypothetical protein
MTPTVTRNSVLVVVGALLLLGPALFPVQPMLYHDPEPGTTENASQLRQEGYEIVAYENLSDRGKELYRQALQEGSLGVPLGAGAPDFAYPTAAELDAVGNDFEQRRALRSVVIERSPDADLPPAAEPVEMAEEIRERRERGRERERNERTPPPTTTDGTTNGTATDRTRTAPETQSTPTLEQRRETIAQYDLMTTRTELPPLTAPPSLARLLAAMLGVVLIGVGGYRYAQP